MLLILKRYKQHNMKKNLLSLIVFTLLSAVVIAQNNNNRIQPDARSYGLISGKAKQSLVTSCDCWVTRDTSWSVAAFDASGGSGGPGLPPDYRNDDWSTDTIGLPFIFCLYGDTVREVFINNNGNVSIGSPYSTFTALSFPDSTYSMVAPFWADVDTRDALLSGIVYYKLGPDYLIVQWDHVGYFNTHADKTNTFQLIMTDGHSNMLPEDKNVGFCYQTMEWSTGDASGGTGGFGGTPATVGVNYGDGINYLQIGLYDNGSFTYDGPFGLNDGVQSLSNQSFAFNVCVNNFNVPPILSGEYICDTINICVGDTFTYTADFLSPEQGQITTVTTNNHGLTGVNVLTTPGIQANIFLSFVATTAGYFTIDVIGSDNGAPAATTSYPLLFNIQNCSVGISDNSDMENIFIPSTMHERLTLNIPNGKNSVTVINSVGRVVYESRTENITDVDVSSCANGIYFITIQSEEKILSRKILKY